MYLSVVVYLMFVCLPAHSIKVFAHQTLGPAKTKFLRYLPELACKLVEAFIIWHGQSETTGADTWKSVCGYVVFGNAEPLDTRKATGRKAKQPCHPAQ